jgi:hypothetical protein
VTELDLRRLGRHVAEQQEAQLEAARAAEGADAAGERTRRFLAEYAARRDGEPRAHGEARSHDAARGRGRRLAFGGERGQRAVRVWRWVGLAALVAVALFALKAAFAPPAPLSFTVGPASEPGVLRDWESAPDDARLPIRFSDGTRVELEPSARARVVAVTHRGAEIVVESGRAHIDVVPAPVSGESPWRVSLGPFAVEVKGTRFDVEWDPQSGDFALDLFEGTVRVSGCHEGHSHTLVAGQGVRASCSEKRWTLVSVSEAEAAEAAAPVGSRTAEAVAPIPSEEAAAAVPETLAPAPRETARPTGPSAVTGSRPTTGSRGVTGPRAVTPRSWQALALDGHYSAAFERALEAGFESECERVGASDLALLGDIARLNGDDARARAAYLAVRQRFDASPAAAQAAFALGRLAVKSDRSAALEWFERSLREAPRGPLAPAAHDWLFELGVETGSPARRREVAQRYLDDHPDGAHAEDARRLLEGHAPR